MLVIGGSVLAQIAGGLNDTTITRLGGNSFIVGTVFWPSGKPVNERMPLRLVSTIAGEFITSTDDKGQFVFSGLTAGVYTIVVDGYREFEPIAQTVDVYQSRSPMPQSYAVTIRLTEKVIKRARPEVITATALGTPKKALEFYKKAIEMSREGDHTGAIAQLRLAVAEYPAYVIALNEMGVQHLRLNELEKAEQVLVAAIKIDPRAYEPLVNRGITLFRLKRYSDAEAALRLALESRPGSGVAHFYLGRVLTSLERYDDAERELRSAIADSDGEIKEAHRMLANLFLIKGEDRRAVKALETYLKLVPDAPDAAKLRKIIDDLNTPRPSAFKAKPL
jgi:Flp pilus assembly protein TadD